MRQSVHSVSPGVNIMTLRDTSECEACHSAAQVIDAGNARPF